MYIYGPSAAINKQSKNWVKFEYHGIGKISFSKRNALFLKSMQFAVHLSTCYLAKSEFINQTPTFAPIFANFCESLFTLYEKNQKLDTVMGM